MSLKADINRQESFSVRHTGPTADERLHMLEACGADSLEGLMEQTVPAEIRHTFDFNQLDAPLTEKAALDALKSLAAKNNIKKSFLGQGYFNCITPTVIKRNILENPGWYTQYTPYQPEISQGRLESLLNFQTMVADLTGLPVSNASLLDEATAAAEAMALCYSQKSNKSANTYFVSEACNPATIEVVRGRAEAMGIQVVVGCHHSYAFSEATFGVLVSYPSTNGTIEDFRDFAVKSHAAGALVTMVTDLLALTLLTPPGELGADIAVGNSQRFGVPLGYGGPHAGFFATRDEYKRKVPGRMVGVSKDREGKAAYRLALQTREQHIRREKATSNICTAQALLANMAGMYAVYHGPKGLKDIALRVHGLTRTLEQGLNQLGWNTKKQAYFDTLYIECDQGSARKMVDKACAAGMNLRLYEAGGIGISLDEATTIEDIRSLWRLFSENHSPELCPDTVADLCDTAIPKGLQRSSEFLTHPIFHQYHSETELMRYINRLEKRDLSLTSSMIPLGSCTMKLNAASELEPVSWAEFSGLHPFVPLDQAQGYLDLFSDLEHMLSVVTGYDGVSLQPNSGAQGEYAGLMAIKAWHESKGEGHRHICLIPTSAHGTNPASANMAGMKVLPVKCDLEGNIDLTDLKAKIAKAGDNLAAIMITYPSTHGVFEEGVREVCDLIHAQGGQVYLDGANLNAQIGLCAPGELGADVSHLNLHKTFCIPHGGGGPGIGPIAVKKHLIPFLPKTPAATHKTSIRQISGAPWGSAGILPIPWMYLKMMGAKALQEASQVAILSANYIATKLEPHYPILYKGKSGRVAHECIIDLRPFKQSAGIEVVDVAKRLMDYGFHAPTMAFPVPGTLMIEPTESEGLAEIDRFCDAMILIREEIRAIETGASDREQNPLKNAPHTQATVCADAWDRPYSRSVAAFPASWTRQSKFWPHVARIDEAWGDRNFFCSCPPMDMSDL